MQESEQPLFTCALQYLPGRCVFLSAIGRYEVEDKNDLLIELVALCDGQRSLAEVRECLGKSNDTSFVSLFEWLESNGLVCAKGKMFQWYHSLVSGDGMGYRSGQSESKGQTKAVCPELTSYPSKRSALGDLLTMRRSCRVLEGCISNPEEIFYLLRAMYGAFSVTPEITTRSVPSAGGFYAFRVLAFVPSTIGTITPGIYEWLPAEDALGKIRDSCLLDEVNHALFRPPYLTEGSVFLALACNVDRVAEKYRNQAYKFMYLEAGHIMQNAYLYCAQEQLGMVELGGYIDSRILSLIPHKEGEMIASCALFGEEVA